MEQQNRKSISIGAEDLKRIIDKNGYYVDKTLMIKELLDSTVMVTLFTRPRRFGKTLNLSMLRRFFEDERTPDGTPLDNRYLFQDLAISKCGESYTRHQQQYPVINLSLKSGKHATFQLAYAMLRDDMIEEFNRHRYVLLGDSLTEQEKKRYEDILSRKEEPELYTGALKFLSSCLEKYHGKKCIILIDEYDVPLENAWIEGFYDQMSTFIRALFESALKTNDSLELAVITGCLRISKESIFTGLNNLRVDSVLGESYGRFFGFTTEEVKAFLNYYGLEGHFEAVKNWYDGYRFGTAEVYNPWSIINYIEDVRKKDTIYPKPYWSNTSSNSIIRELIEEAGPETRDEIEQLIAGETIEKPIYENITYGDVHRFSDNLWNFLFFTGYLKSCGQRYDGEKTFIKMGIPNTEVQMIYRDMVLSWFDAKLAKADLMPLMRAVEKGDCEAMADLINDQLMDTISFFDYGESYYHGFMAGLLKAAGGYQVLSNRESGEGRADIIMKTRFIRNGSVFIFEIKVARTFDGMEKACREALQQIEIQKYEENLRREGYQNISKYGVCFFKKECIVAKG